MDLLIDSAVANTGQGARTVTITVDDGTNSLENAMVRLTSGAESYNGAANASGVVTLQVDDATWDIDITHTLHTFTSTTLVVDGNKAETYSMTAVALAASDVDKTTGYTYTLNSSGVATQGIAVDIQAAYSGQWSAAGVVHAGTSRSETSDADGLVEFTNLVQGGEYDISSVSGETIRVTVPTDAGATYQLPTVVGGTGA